MSLESWKSGKTASHVTVPGSMFHSSVDSSFNWLNEGKTQKPWRERHPVQQSQAKCYLQVEESWADSCQSYLLSPNNNNSRANQPHHHHYHTEVSIHPARHWVCTL